MKKLFVSLCLCLFSLLALTTVCMATIETEAASKISEAENAVNLAYEAVLEADKSGANISGLLIRLNSAGEFLAEAQMYYREGKFENATQYANSSRQEVNGLIEEAEQLKTQATIEYENRLLWTTSASGVAICAIVLGSIIGWRFFKQYYFARVSKMKTEATQ